MDYILSEGVRQEEKGVHILDVNVGLPDIDEKQLLTKSVFELQSVLDLPLQIDSSSPEAMEAALRIYNGKALINSVNGKVESMEKIFPLAKKYGGVIIALTLDESGIPETADGRIKIAEKIFNLLLSYLFSKNSGIVLDERLWVILLVLLARSFQARKHPRTALPTPIQIEPKPMFQPCIPA